MYVPDHFAISDVATVHAFLRDNVFATIAGTLGGSIVFAYAPTVFDSRLGSLGGLRFHVARANPLSEIRDSDTLKISVMGAHAYVSPDWYETEGLVPTWNYRAIEGTGPARRLGDLELRRLLAELTAQEESALAPKAPWKMGRVPLERLDALLKAIVGFELTFETLEGKAKLSQNRAEADVLGVIRGLESRGDAASMAVAAVMRKARGGEGV
jgi:transcriptional regulator